MHKIKRILAVHMGGIGNVVLFTPALKSLRQGFPQAYICLLLARWSAEGIMEDSPLIDEILVYDNRWSILKKIRFIISLRRKRFDLILTATGINPLKAGILTYLIGAPYRLGGKSRTDIHEIEANLDIIRALDIKIEKKDLCIYLSKEDREFAVEFIKSHGVKDDDIIVGFHPGSGPFMAYKRWPVDRFSQLADAISYKYRARIIVFGGTEEIDLAIKMADLMETRPIIAAGKTTLKQVAAIIERCNLFVSNDTGLMHIACAVHTPVVAVFGPTDPVRTGPWGGIHTVVQKKQACAPCYNYNPVRCKNLDCLYAITVEDVFQTIGNQLRKLQISSRQSQ